MALEQFFGRIVDVVRRTDGDELVTAAAIGATVLYVEDTTDFDETGGQVLLGGTVYAYSKVDHDANTLTLSTGLTLAGAVGDPVDAYSTELGQIVVEYVAHVLLDDQDRDDEPIEVTVNHALVPMLVESVRGGASESVTLVRDGEDDLVIWQVDGKLATELVADQALINAASAADQAMNALTAAELAEAVTDGHILYYYQTSIPWANGSTNRDANFGDCWVDTDSVPKVAYRWKNTRVWTLIADGSLVAALFDAQDAQVTADGKIAHYVGTWALPAGPPPSVGTAHSYGDVYTKTNEDNREYYWSGTAWVANILGDAGIAATLTGKIIQTAFSGNRIRMRQDAAGGVVEGFTGLASETPGVLDPQVSGSQPAMQLKSGTTPTYPNFAEVFLTAGSAGTNSIVYLGADKVVVPQTITIANGLTVTAGGASVTGNSSVSGAFNATGNITAGNQLHGNTLWSDVDAGGVNSGADIGADGKIKRTTSSKRYKKLIRKAKVDVAAVLGLVPRTFKRRDEKDGPEYLGLIAEEVADAGVDHLAFHDAEGRVDGIHYNALTVSLLAVCQSQQTQIDDLTARVEALEA